ncbi:MAG: RNA-binding protein [Patescibacteria group bacterium]
MSNNKLFVGSLPYRVSDEELSEFFSEAGTVTSAHVMMDKMTGRSRGFGFVEMSTDEEAQKAIEMFNDQEVDGRRIIVNVARPREERPAGGGGGRRDFGGGGSRGPRREGGYNNRRDY